VAPGTTNLLRADSRARSLSVGWPLQVDDSVFDLFVFDCSDRGDKRLDTGRAVPVTLIWGRHDPVSRLPVAEAASERYGWPLQVIEGARDDPPLGQPRAFLGALPPALPS